MNRKMGIIARDENQITLIYSSNTRIGKVSYGILNAIDKPYYGIDIVKSKVSDTQWAEIADALNVRVGDLVDKKNLPEEIEDTSAFDDHDWITIIQSNNKAISRPIVIYGSKTLQIRNPSELYKFFGVESAGLEQSPSSNNALDIERTTDDDTFVQNDEE